MIDKHLLLTRVESSTPRSGVHLNASERLAAEEIQKGKCGRPHRKDDTSCALLEIVCLCPEKGNRGASITISHGGSNSPAELRSPGELSPTRVVACVMPLYRNIGDAVTCRVTRGIGSDLEMIA